MRLVVKSPVWDDLREIGATIAEDNPDVAERFLTSIQDTFHLLESHPRIGRLRSFSTPGIRSWVVSEFPSYVIFYLVSATELQILAVLHGSRDVASALSKRSE